MEPPASDSTIYQLMLGASAHFAFRIIRCGYRHNVDWKPYTVDFVTCITKWVSQLFLEMPFRDIFFLDGPKIMWRALSGVCLLLLQLFRNKTPVGWRGRVRPKELCVFGEQSRALILAVVIALCSPQKRPSLLGQKPVSEITQSSCERERNSCLLIN